ncbi:hypothetical protein GNZ12_35620 [Paraburkholderia sp. 1N]|uniref:Uncharacterized protein n=1 Tax=Paraburkholderia solitsugae TaxID=2675748 RepID=A0ABX2C0D9_9BURK|nr:hypothetical protein [Paraburkholderia solitsugae]NPT46552.1 hypothetical protein [Paraburkholderia solitsugae]
MMKPKALQNKMGAIDNSHSPQEWTAPSTPQKITVPLMRALQQRFAMSASPIRQHTFVLRELNFKQPPA